MTKHLAILTAVLLVFLQAQSKVSAEFIGETSQNPAAPTTSEFVETQPVPEAPVPLPTSESFLAANGGIAKADSETNEKNHKTDNQKKQGDSSVYEKNRNTYDKQKCEEIPEGWSCTAFYIGGNKKQELSSQEHSEGDSEKGSSWRSQLVKEWDSNGHMIKNEAIRVQEEWNNDEEKGYHYTQRYKNGILEYENYQSVHNEDDQQKQGIILEYGKL